ncbi:Methyl farnesoate epoxidase [Orchesella cincta]|uniref:Methyl farnesoate epoxidase n=1 Tax=Orchesella cincta TaxID=48709 RepID=A0A1D2MYI9_ORCCI|nr:Methyl farnesoate epoxidase [Orchesella cincta]
MLLEYTIAFITMLIIWTIVDNFIPSMKLPPGPLRLPVFGNALTFLQNKSTGKPVFVLFRDLAKQYGNVVYLRMGSQPTVIVDDFDTAKTMLNNDVWIDRPFNDMMAERSYGKPLGIIFVGGEGWKEMRRFTMRSLRDFGYGKQNSMQSIIEDEVKTILNEVENVAGKDKPLLKIKHFFTLPVLNILWSMVSSVKMPGDEEKLKKLIILVDNLAKATPIGGSILDLFPSLRHYFPGLTGITFVRKCVAELQNHFQEVLDSRRKEGGYKQGNRDYIDMFINEIDKHKKLGSNPNHYTGNEIIIISDEQFITTITDLFEGGSETSSNTLEFAVYYVMKNPRVQRKIQEEIDQVVGRSRLPTFADRPQMPYTEATLHEVQRMANVLPVTVRSSTESCRLNEYDIEKSAMGIVNIYSIHMDKTFWGDPDNFRPERFLNENNEIISQKANRVIPFGAGKRVCLGEQMARATVFTYFTALLQSYSFEEVSEESKVSANKNDLNRDPEIIRFEKEVHVGFTLSPNPYQTKVVKRL